MGQVHECDYTSCTASEQKWQKGLASVFTWIVKNTWKTVAHTERFSTLTPFDWITCPPDAVHNLQSTKDHVLKANLNDQQAIWHALHVSLNLLDKIVACQATELPKSLWILPRLNRILVLIEGSHKTLFLLGILFTWRLQWSSFAPPTPCKWYWIFLNDSTRDCYIVQKMW